jgi:hypothetical protein
MTILFLLINALFGIGYIQDCWAFNGQLPELRRSSPGDLATSSGLGTKEKVSSAG